ncbi:MAG: hypothetical protein Q9199_007460 [Rusavskia elegans]
MHDELDVIATNLKNAQSVWGLQSKQYRACEELLIDYLRDSADKSVPSPEHKIGNGVAGSSSGSNLPFRPAK